MSAGGVVVGAILAVEAFLMLLWACASFSLWRENRLLKRQRAVREELRLDALAHAEAVRDLNDETVARVLAEWSS